MLLVCLITLTGFARDGKIFSFGPEGKNYFTQAEDRILIQFLDGTSFEEKSAILSKYAGTQKLKSDDVLPAPDVTIARTNGLTAEEIDALLIALNQNPKVVYANPFVIYSDGTYQGIQNRIIIRLKSDKDLTMGNRCILMILF
jgi:hypothetical protein